MRIIVGVILLAALVTVSLAVYHGWKAEFNDPLGISRILAFAISCVGMVFFVGYRQRYTRDGSLVHQE